MLNLLHKYFLSSTNWLFELLLVLISFFSPIAILFHMIIGLVLIDLITGIFKDIKVKQVKGFFSIMRAIKSNKLRRTVVKAFLYILFIMGVYLVPTATFGQPLYLVNVAAALIGLVELKSVAENMDIVTGKTLFTDVFKILRKKTEDSINKKIDTPE